MSVHPSRPLAVAICVVLSIAPASSRAEDDVIRGWSKQGVEIVALSGGVTQISTGDGAFKGAGRLTPGAPLTPFRVTGRDLGLVRPVGGFGDWSIRYVRGPLILGGTFAMGAVQQDATPTAAATLANGGSNLLMASGMDVGVEMQAGQSFRLRGIGRLGYRWLTVAMDGYAPEGRSSPSATYGGLWVQGRIEPLYFLPLDGHSDGDGGIAIGAFASYDFSPSESFSAGLTFVFRVVD
jgi:hypothetical protein